MVSVNWDTVKERVKGVGVFTYWAVGIILITTISYVLYTRFNKQVASLLVFMTSLLALYYYYVKWFVIGVDKEPPIGLCPEFMTSIGVHPKGASESPQVICVDRIGAATGSFNGGDSAIAANVSHFTTAPDPAGEVMAQGSNGYGYVITPTAQNLSNADSFCGKLKTIAGLSWIGVC